MRRCPTCNRTFEDETLTYCTDDGTPLTSDAPSSASSDSPDSMPTLIASSPVVTAPAANQLQPTQAYNAGQEQGEWKAPPPPPYVPPSAPPPRTRSKLPWVIGGAVVFLLGIIVLGGIIAFLLSRDSSDDNTNRPVNNSNSLVNTNANNQNSNRNTNSQTNGEQESGAPTDEDAVLEELTKIENEWAEANINGDKEYLENLLADDYIGTAGDGTTQTKKEYIDTLQPEDTIKSQTFDNLELNLNGASAIITGYTDVKFKNGANRRFQFKDTFAWRGAEWKAVASETSPVK